MFKSEASREIRYEKKIVRMKWKMRVDGGEINPRIFNFPRETKEEKNNIRYEEKKKLKEEDKNKRQNKKKKKNGKKERNEDKT